MLQNLDATRGGDVANAPEVGQLLVIDGIRSVFLASDFITITRESNADWQPILVEAARLIGLAGDADSGLADKVAQPEEPKNNLRQHPDKHQQNLGRLRSPSRSFEAFRFRFVPGDAGASLCRIILTCAAAIAATQAN